MKQVFILLLGVLQFPIVLYSFAYILYTMDYSGWYYLPTSFLSFVLGASSIMMAIWCCIRITFVYKK